MIVDSIVSNVDAKRPVSADRVTQFMNAQGGISLKFNDDSIKSLFFPELSSGYDVRRSGVIVGSGVSSACYVYKFNGTNWYQISGGIWAA